MKITQLAIRNFRCIEKFEAKIKNDFLCIVGQNDAGKSTVMRAIRIFLGDISISVDDFPKNREAGKIEIEVHFKSDYLTELQHENLLKLKKVFSLNNDRVKEEIFLFTTPQFPSIEELEDYKTLKKVLQTLNLEIPSKKPSKNELDVLKNKVKSEIELRSSIPDWVEAGEIWNKVKEFLPEVVYIPAAQDHESEQKVSSDSTAFGKLFRVGIRKWLQEDRESNYAISVIQSKVSEINQKILGVVEEKLREQLPLADKLIQRLDPLDVSKGFSFTMQVKDSHGVETPLSQRGSGLQRAVLVAAIRAQKDINNMINQLKNDEESEISKDEKKNDSQLNTLYLFEEPEAFLHLAAQKELFYSLKDLTKQSSQVFVTTHSTLFIDEGEMEDLVLLTRKNGSSISLQHIPLEDIKDELGEIVRISELITGKVCCIVEGKSDKLVLQAWMKKLGYDYKKLGIHFIPMDGCSNAEYYANAAILFDFEVDFIMLLDTDYHSMKKSEEIKAYLESKYPFLKKNNRIRLLKGEIENYFSLEAVSKALNIPIEYIDLNEYKVDPKKALWNAYEEAYSHGHTRAKKYNETRDSKKIAELMTIEEIIGKGEIISLIESLVTLAGGTIIKHIEQNGVESHVEA
jgi:putative ATP-dependent endonuclease of the OLD family